MDIFSWKGTSGITNVRWRAMKAIRGQGVKNNAKGAILAFEGAYWENPNTNESPSVHDNPPNVYTCEARFYK